MAVKACCERAFPVLWSEASCLRCWPRSRLLWLGQAHAERRAAIVVGNSEYPFAPLTNPRSDAKLIANTLTELNFDVLLFYDVKKSAAKDLKDAISAHLLGADMAVFYYAGHALQYDGQNLLLPVDTRTTSAKEVVG